MKIFSFVIFIDALISNKISKFPDAAIDLGKWLKFIENFYFEYLLPLGINKNWNFSQYKIFLKDITKILNIDIDSILKNINKFLNKNLELCKNFWLNFCDLITNAIEKSEPYITYIFQDYIVDSFFSMIGHQAWFPLLVLFYLIKNKQTPVIINLLGLVKIIIYLHGSLYFLHLFGFNQYFLVNVALQIMQSKFYIEPNVFKSFFEFLFNFLDKWSTLFESVDVRLRNSTFTWDQPYHSYKNSVICVRLTCDLFYDKLNFLENLKIIKFFFLGFFSTFQGVCAILILSLIHKILKNSKFFNEINKGLSEGIDEYFTVLKKMFRLKK